MNSDNYINTKFQHLPEVVLEEHFHNLFKEFIEVSSSLNEEKQIALLEILGEKFEKLYDPNKLNLIERKFIPDQLIKLTNFSEIKRICELTGLMFAFNVNSYYDFLQDSLKTKHMTLKVRKEIAESI